MFRNGDVMKNTRREHDIELSVRKWDPDAIEMDKLGLVRKALAPDYERLP